MDIYTVFHTCGLEKISIDCVHHDEYCFVHDSCDIKDSYSTLDAAINAVTNEINLLVYTPVGYPINVVQTTVHDDNLEFGPCWAIEDKLGYSYFIVKRKLH